MAVCLVAVFVLCVAAPRVAGQDVTPPVTTCNTRFTDPASSTLLADIVLQGTVNQLRQASPLAPHLYRATVSVHKVYKGQQLLSDRGAAGSRASASNVTVERFGPEENAENCVARAITGQAYLFFLRLTDDQQAHANQGSPPAGPASDASHTVLLITALPHDIDLQVLRDVKRVLCPGCAARPVIKKLRCKNCAIPPSMRRKMAVDDTKLVKPGKRLTLRCVARGVPRPAYTWYKDGRRLGDPPVHADGESSSDEVYRAGGLSVRTSRRHSLLVIKSVAPSDQGVYQCVAANAVGESHQTARIVIKGSQPPAGDPVTAPGVTSGQASSAVTSDVVSDACLGNPCYHGGTCYTESDGGARCECTGDYHGRRCQFRRRRVEPDLAEEGEITGQGSKVILSERSDGQDERHDQVLELDTAVPSSSDTGFDEETVTTDLPHPDSSEDTDTHFDPPTPALPDQPPTFVSEKERRKHLTNARGRYEADVTQSGDAAKHSKSGAPKLKVAECPDKDYCMNGGQCKMVVKIQRRFCECPREYAGRRCERKIV